MIINKNVKGSQPIKPNVIEKNNDVVYIRSNIQEKTEKIEDVSYKVWEYDENQLTRSEYDQLLNLSLIISDDAWNDGLQTAFREARYKRMDGPEQSARRKIELGIDVEKNQTKLQTILEYKQAVNETKNQPGYPNNVPVYPPEPEFEE